jgi:hypothetical protein
MSRSWASWGAAKVSPKGARGSGEFARLLWLGRCGGDHGRREFGNCPARTSRRVPTSFGTKDVSIPERAVLFAPIGFTWLGLTGSAIRPTRHQLGPGRTRQGPGLGLKTIESFHTHGMPPVS